MQSDNPAALIAMDLATAIHTGLIPKGDRLPAQVKLAKSYGVAVGTVVNALRKLRECGLTQSMAGLGVFAAADDWPDLPQEYAVKRPGGEVALLFRAADICRSLAATRHPDGVRAQFHDTAYDFEEGREVIVRSVDASALDGLDRVMLRALGDAFAAAARRFVGYGPAQIDRYLLTMAEAVVRNGARRDPTQPPIALAPGTPDEEEHVALRIWPERAELANGAQF